MGRIFETRKHTILARNDRMSKAFTRIGKEIAIAVKQNGPDPANNPRLRMAIQNAKGANMPKDRVEAAIKKASSKEEKDFEESIYEGYAPHGVAIVMECATDNPTRTVANIRMYFSKWEGNLAKSGSVDYMFDRKGVFKIEPGQINLDELELDLIDAGAEDINKTDDEVVIYTKFTDFGNMQKFLEGKGIAVKSAGTQRFPTVLKELSEEQAKDVIELIQMLEEDDDVQAVYHNLQ
jgi:YebC/PmpR family DNA-binding regulatory protein